MKIDRHLFDQCFEYLPLMIYNIGSDGKILNCNCLAVETLGYQDKMELIGKPVYFIYAPSCRAKAKKLFQEWKKLGKLENEELQVVTKKGEILDVILSVNTIHDDKGQPLYSLSTHIDITKLKGVERKLRESEDFGFSLLNNAPIPIIVLERGRSIKYVNSAFEKLTGFSSEELVGAKPPYPWWTVKKGMKTFPEFEQAMRKGAVRVEQLFQKKNKEKFWVVITSIPIKSKGRLKYYISNWIDITERKAVEKSIQQQQKKLENSEKELQRFSRKILSIREEEKKNISSMLHDELGCMVVVLSSGMTAMEEEIKNQNYKKALKVLSKCKKSLKRYSSNLRKIAVELRPPDLNIVGLPEALKEYLSDLKKNNQMKIDFQVDMEGMSIDEEAAIVLYRIAQESLTNVIKHAEAKKVDMKICGSDNTVLLLIRDDGKGFDLKKKSRLQEKHLGLRSMKEMTESLDGVFLLESEKNAGTEITVSIPMERRSGP